MDSLTIVQVECFKNIYSDSVLDIDLVNLGVWLPLRMEDPLQPHLSVYNKIIVENIKNPSLLGNYEISVYTLKNLD